MRILWLKPGGLWPPTSGGRIRSLETLSHLSHRNAVTVLTTHGPKEDPEGLARRLGQCRVISVPFRAPRQGTAAFAGALVRSWLAGEPVDLWKWRVPALRRHAAALLAEDGADMVVADFLVSAANVPPLGDIPLVLFEHNVEYRIWQRLANVELWRGRRWLLEREWRAMLRAEAAACARADLTIAVSDEDCAELQRLAPGARCVAVPTGVDTEYFRSSGRAPVGPRLVFTGSMDWYPNEDAVLHFASDILPRIREAVPDVTLKVVGRNPSARLRAHSAAVGIELTGTVDDVRPHMDEAAVYIVPLRVGGGTRLKIFEALAMSRAVISTSVGAEGLHVTPGRDLEIADGAEAFAAAVVALLRDPRRRAELGRRGRQLVAARHSWSRVTDVFEHHCRTIVSQRQAPADVPAAG
jgi:glycosyltransferase involved in cell wall biosynthesis